jgi:hypothetical protein
METSTISNKAAKWFLVGFGFALALWAGIHTSGKFPVAQLCLFVLGLALCPGALTAAVLLGLSLNSAVSVVIAATANGLLYVTIGYGSSCIPDSKKWFIAAIGMAAFVVSVTWFSLTYSNWFSFAFHE